MTGLNDGPYQVRYLANVSAASPIDSYVIITNAGANGASLQSGSTANIPGSICANVYVFSPDEQMISCCSCPVTPNGLVSLSAKQDLVSNTLTPIAPDSVVVALVANQPLQGTCEGAATKKGALVNGMLAWAVTGHATPAGGIPSAITETSFSSAALSTSEYARLTDLCTFIQSNGSGYGICNSCRLGAFGAARR